MSPSSYLTPYKSNRLVVAPSYRQGAFDSHAVDAPFLFAHEGRTYMTYVGWDTIGYRTGLASSSDLISWQPEGLILDRGPKNSPTEFNAALTSILRDNELFGPGTLKKVDGRYVGTYHAYPKPGYEAGSAAIGLCYSRNLRDWEVADPILTADPSCPWEAGGLYKSWLLEHEGQFFLFYNAKDASPEGWREQIGVATSSNLKDWTRHAGNPIVPHGAPSAFDDIYASDPAVFRDKDRWVMFYYGFSSDGHARDGAAVAEDLFVWKKTGEILIDVGPEGSVDSVHAHKPGIITRGKDLFHFYCAVHAQGAASIGEVDAHEIRGIAVATSAVGAFPQE